LLYVSDTASVCLLKKDFIFFCAKVFNHVKILIGHNILVFDFLLCLLLELVQLIFDVFSILVQALVANEVNLANQRDVGSLMLTILANFDFRFVLKVTLTAYPCFIFPVVFNRGSKESVEEGQSHQETLCENPVHPLRLDRVRLASVENVFILDLPDHDLQTAFLLVSLLLILLLLSGLL